VEADRAVEKYPEDAHPLRLPKSITQLSLILRKLKVAHFVRARRGPFTFDILERDRRLIWECNNFDRYYGGFCQLHVEGSLGLVLLGGVVRLGFCPECSLHRSSFDKLAPRRLEERILKAMGYKIVQVPFWHWRRVTLKSRRIDMIRMSRFIALRDFRERHMAQGDADQYSDPTKFNARECALDSNSFQYIGENFFKAQKPSKAWMLSGAGLKLGRLGQSRGFGKKAKEGQQQQEEEAVPMKAVSRPAAPPPVPKYAVDGSKLDSRTATGGGSCSPKEIGVVMAEAVSEATLKQVLSEAAEGKTDDDLFRVLTTANAD
ncbi:hypothetical protein FOZ62_022981, partial [Perkinsus olseni]